MAKKSVNSAKEALTATAANEITKKLSDATEQVFKDSSELSKIMKQYENALPEHARGRAFEFIEVLKFNKDAVLKSSNLRAEATSFLEPHSPTDINIKVGVNIIKHVQAKSSHSPAFSIRNQAEERYTGMDRLIHKDQVNDAKNLIREHVAKRGDRAEKWIDVEKNLTGELKKDGVTSGGTTLKEAEQIARNPETEILKLKATQVAHEVGGAALSGAAIGGVFTLIFKSMAEGYAVAKGKKKLSEAIPEVLAATLSASVKSGVISGGAKTVSVAAREVGLNGFSRSAGPAAVAVIVYEIAANVVKLSKGEIDSEEFYFQSGGSLVKGCSTFYYGMAGQILIPIPVVGAAAGAMVGYLASNILYQSGLLGGKNCIVSKGRKERVVTEKLCADAIEKMEYYKKEIIRCQRNFKNIFSTNILEPIASLELCLIYGNYHEAINKLEQLAITMNMSLPFRTFEEFDLFMRNKNSALVI